VSQEKQGIITDSKCLKLTSLAGSKEEKCDYFEVSTINKNLEKMSTNIPSGVYTLDEFKEYSKDSGYCPYYLSRRAVFFFIDLAFLCECDHL
jgi:hypothetical protein